MSLNNVSSYLIFRTSANEVKVAEKPTELEVEKNMDRQSSAESGIQKSFAKSPKYTVYRLLSIVLLQNLKSPTLLSTRTH